MANTKLKHVTKFERSGRQRNRAHSPHYVIITKKGFIQCPWGLVWFKKEAEKYAKENIKEYYEIHKDYFVE